MIVEVTPDPQDVAACQVGWRELREPHDQPSVVPEIPVGLDRVDEQRCAPLRVGEVGIELIRRDAALGADVVEDTGQPHRPFPLQARRPQGVVSSPRRPL